MNKPMIIAGIVIIVAIIIGIVVSANAENSNSDNVGFRNY